MGNISNLSAACGCENPSFTPFLFIIIFFATGGFFVISEKLNNILYNNIEQRAYLYFSKTLYQVGIYFGCTFSIFFLAFFFTGLFSLMSGRNLIKGAYKKLKFKLFGFRCFHYILIICTIDIISYFLLFWLISPYSISYLITDFFTEPIFLFYLLIYYRIFKKVDFRKKQIIFSFIFFLLGMISMLIGLSKFYCRGNATSYSKSYKCKENTDNYFSNYYFSIFISIIIMPFLHFIRAFYSKKYIEINDANVIILSFKIQFIDCIFGLLIYLITSNFKIELYIDLFPILLALTNVLNEICLLYMLKYKGLILLFVIFIIRKLHFHITKASNEGVYFFFMIPPIILNMLGLMTFLNNGEYYQFKVFTSPLTEEEKNELNSGLILSNKKEEDNNLVINNENQMTNLDDAITPDGNENSNTYNTNNTITIKGKDGEEKETNETIQNLEKEIICLKNENNILKNKNKELEKENKSLNLKIRSLQIRNQSLAELNEKYSEKIALLSEKEALNDNNKESNETNS